MGSRASPLRSHLSSSAPRHQQPSISSAASAQLRHLQEVAAWASTVVPPLGAFLGSRLASTCELLGCLAPSSPHFTCQRCESILQVGINCSIRVRSRKWKKRSAVSKGVSSSINSIICTCQYCAYENVKSGTSKAYVKTKLSEVAARRKLSEPYEKLDDCMADKGTQPTKAITSELISSPKALTESVGGICKRMKRKGWLSLKQLAASSADLSSVGSRPDFNMRSAKSPLVPQARIFGSPRVMPAVSQVDFKRATPVLSIEGEFSSRITSIKTTLELEQCKAPPDDIGSNKSFSFINAELARLDDFTTSATPVMCFSGGTTSHRVKQSEVSDSFGVVATDAKVLPILSKEEKLLTDATDFPLVMEQSNGFGLTMNFEDGLRCDADATNLEQFALLTKCCCQDTKATLAQWNSSDLASQIDLEIVAPSSSIQGLATGGDVTLNSSFLKPGEDACLPSMFKDDIDQFEGEGLQSPVNEKGVSEWITDIVTLNESIIKPVNASSPAIFKLDAEMLQSPINEEVGLSPLRLSPLRKRQLNDDYSWCKIATMQDSFKRGAGGDRFGDLDRKDTNVELSGSICKQININALGRGRKVSSTKKRPLFKRVGCHWFTICKSNRMFRWRMI